jgi:hypothetical protein
LTLYWQALLSEQPDYTRFVHLFDPDTEAVVSQNDGQPRNNSYPTSQWLAGEIVADTITLDLTDVPPGAYEIATGFYWQEGENFPRLMAEDPQNGVQFPAGRVSLPALVER